MTTYTVVLDRPPVLSEAADIDWVTNVYVVIGIEADTKKQAVKLAQNVAYTADAREWGAQAMHRWELTPGDYLLSVMFEGTHEPCLFGWQSH